ncbi:MULTISPECIES: MarR family winged helix-turn-helix transcriptional regulator [Adlercreutzia]|uniref:HTH marR-type domain-containing protein n=1 Tax=Adlercreutzia hattorii TaxID=2707299 RepID=A0A6F8SK45_9ACTN|nr:MULTISPECIES: MarR family winged helix-turn-helix transcriptional regulator [Adlercreutzia]MCQ5070639.1 MarR family winged helix-turn-helix transcriptional regulator [Adlercreutzia sp. DFI.6.23]BCA88251.1 hypothetical protein ADCFC_08700 [Adlercreutzia hattorii]
MEHGGTAMADAFAAEVVFDRWLGRVVHRLRASRVATLNQFWVLLLVDIHHDVSIRSVADRLEISYTTLAECIDELCRAGALSKTTDEDDRRATRLSVTPQGRRLTESIDRELIAVAKQALSLLSGTSRTQAMHLLYDACLRLNKKRLAGNLVRGDSAFFIVCQQVSLEFSRICRQSLVTPQQGHLLLALGRTGPMTGREIRDALDYDAPMLSKIAAKLSDAGLITKEIGNNRRERLYALTSLGLQCASLIAEGTEEMLRQLFGDDYGTETYRQTIAALGRSLRDDLPARQQ